MEIPGRDPETRGLVPLAQRLGAGGGDPAWFLRLAVALCTALTDLHRRHVIYGRLDPSRVLVSGDAREVRLLDPPGRQTGHGAGTGGEYADGAAAAYMSPEQTGRINRAVDHRSDFYALGAVLYAALTGGPPFRSTDRLEIVHAHIARTPVPPAAVDPRIPEQISRIVMRLLAKGAGERYQSAAGVRSDLQACERELLATGAITLFEPGRDDVAERLRMPRRLFGRDRELAVLTEAFERTCAGETSLLFVSGYSGIGKTSLIGEWYKPIVRQRGYFASGKFDQVARNIPYGALIQALRGFVWQLLTESEDRLGGWRGRLLDALGNTGGVLTEVIPEVEFVIGRQPAPAPVDPAEAQNRFRFAFQNFLRTVARAEHPLVLFLDDLQWVDAATLGLLHDLVTAADISHLLFIGAYRDHEVDAAHPLRLATTRLEASGAPVRAMTLGPLGVADIRGVLSDTLRRRPEEVAAFADLIVAKTGGNPFFVIQFLKSLEQDGLLRFDGDAGRWTFDMAAVAAAGMTDNVIDLMTGRIRRLSPEAQSMLTLAACIGSRFELSTFLTVSRLSAEAAADGFAESLEAGLIEPSVVPGEAPAGPGAGTAYAFLHDRVQQAAYELIPPDRQARTHLDVGRLLLAGGADVAEDRLFETVNHLNIGRALISNPDERAALARLNLAAGRKARTSAAYDAAARYLEQGIALLADVPWESDADLMFTLGLEAAESQYLSGRFDAAERHFDRLLERARTALQRVQVHSLRIVLYENLSRYADALASARLALALVGLSFPERDDQAAVAAEAEIAAIQRLLGGRPISSLVALPEMTDPEVRALMRVLTLMWSAAYISGYQETARLISATMVRLTLEHGVTEDSAYGCVTHAITMGPVRQDYAAAYEWGVLALRLNDRFADTKYRAKIHQQFHAHVNLWRRPFATCIPYAREARRSGLESGDFNYAGYGAVTEAWPALMISRSLDDFLATHTPDLALLERIRMEDFRAALQVLLNWALALQGRTAGPVSLATGDFDEAAFVAKYERSAPFFLTFLFTARLHLCVLHGRYTEAVQLLEQARRVTVVGTMWPVLLDFWGSLAMTGAWPQATPEERARYHTALTAARGSLQRLADHCPENYQCFWLLVSAGMERISGNAPAARDLCERAIAFARQTDNLQQEALASELCAEARLALGDEAGATACLLVARRAYLAWGAAAKVARLGERYGHLFAQPATFATTPTDPAPESAALDMSTVLKVSRAVAVEIELRNLLPQLMNLALENAGADRALFIRAQDGELIVEAEAATDAPPALPPADASGRFSQSIVRYVRRTGQDVVIGHPADDERFAGDPYLAAGHARSILGVPVIQQGRIDGILYLENSLTHEAFTPARTEMMRILAGQAAISLENARLYEGLKDEVARRTQAEQSLLEALAELEALKNRLEAENVYLQEEIRTQHNFNEIVGNSRVLLASLRRVELVAPTDSTVLILGETGSGKELFARAIHSRSRRSGRPLVKVNCGAIAPGLVESELFGHVKGAFTGAIEKRVGRFELASGGTILLDEVGELPLDAQVKLLRVLQEQEFEPVGSSRTVRVDVRVIAATNRDLDRAVRDGRFRADLLYRLNVFPIQIPPLRDRAGDVPLLVSLFVDGLARRLGKPLRGFSARGMEQLMAYQWPGNVRELQNVVERAAILAGGPILDVEGAFTTAPQPSSPPAAIGGDTLENVQRAHITAVLETTGGVVEGARGAAAILGLHPNTLRSRMRKLGISTARAGS